MIFYCPLSNQIVEAQKVVACEDAVRFCMMVESVCIPAHAES